MQLPGVVDKLDHNDVPGSNMTGPVIMDEEIFVSKEVSIFVHVIVYLRCKTK